MLGSPESLSCPMSMLLVCAQSLSTARQAPPSMEFSRQEYWNELPFPSPWDFPDPGIKPTSLEPPELQADSSSLGLPSWH